MKRILFGVSILSMLLFVACGDCCDRALQLEEYTFESSEPERYMVNIRYQHIANSDKSDILRSIEAANYNHIFEEYAFVPADVDASMRAMADAFIADAVESDSGAAYTLNFDQAAFTVRDSSVLCYETHIDIYTGGAHGGNSIWYECYSLVTGQPYDFSYLYEGEWSARLCELLYNSLVEAMPDSLFINGYKELPHADSVLITDTGLLFVYQPYSVASFAAGILSVELSDEDLKATGVPMLWLNE